MAKKKASTSIARKRKGSSNTDIKQKSHLKLILKILILLFVIAYFGLPIIVKCSYTIQSELLFMNHVNLAPFSDLNDPSKSGLNNTISFRVNYKNCTNIGAWHILPQNATAPHLSDNIIFGTHAPVILYNHGNCASRALAHRVEIYKRLAIEGYEVVTFDYRGYADSPGVVSEEGVVEDAICMFDYVKKNSNPGAKIYMWGHSLGAAISIQAIYKMKQSFSDIQPDILILENPFYSLKEAVKTYPLVWPCKLIPGFTEWLINGLQFNFDSNEKITQITSSIPILITHGGKDIIIPYWHGEALYETAKLNSSESDGCLEFLGLPLNNHHTLYSSPLLYKQLREFISHCT